MEVLKYTLSKGAKAPLKATAGAAGYDCFALSREFLTLKDGELTPLKASEVGKNDLVRYCTGISMEIPRGYAVLTFARSSIVKMPLIMANTTGVVDSDYRGEVMFMFRILNPENIQDNAYQIGDRVGQLLIVKLGEFDLVKAEKLSDSERGSGGYGSTGR